MGSIWPRSIESSPQALHSGDDCRGSRIHGRLLQLQCEVRRRIARLPAGAVDRDRDQRLDVRGRDGLGHRRGLDGAAGGRPRLSRRHGDLCDQPVRDRAGRRRAGERGAAQGRQPRRAGALGAGRHDLPGVRPRRAGWPRDGRRRRAGVRRECDQRAAPAPLPRRRRQCALGLAVQPQRCARQPRGGGRGERRDRDRHRMAGPPGRGHHGEPVPVLGDQHRAAGAGRAAQPLRGRYGRASDYVTKSTSCRAEMRMASWMSARSCSRSNSSFSLPAGETQNSARVGVAVLLA